jgi:uncharacterized protein (DUF488 family)
MTAATLRTIGYEGCRIDQVLDCLVEAGVGVLIDVRALPLSRKPGFSKRQLAAGLDERGIAYVHLRALGTPKPGRDAARAGRTGEMQRIFRAHMTGEQPQLQLAEAAAIAVRRRCCLLCFEADHRRCHRDIVGGMICAATGQEVEHLLA